MKMCTRAGCDQPGLHKAGGTGNSMYCTQHIKMKNMRDNAKKAGKHVPTYDELEAMVPDPLACPVCHLEMRWASDDQREVVSLQHWANGTLSLVCQSCNSRMKVRDEIPPEGMHWCRICERNLPLDHFAKRRTRNDQPQSHCKECGVKHVREYKQRCKLQPSPKEIE